MLQIDVLENKYTWYFSIYQRRKNSMFDLVVFKTKMLNIVLKTNRFFFLEMKISLVLKTHNYAEHSIENKPSNGIKNKPLAIIYVLN